LLLDRKGEIHGSSCTGCDILEMTNRNGRTHS
jgi:hypothetical protein